MAERITERELVEIEEFPGPPCDCVRLCEEARRLRGIIVEASGAFSGGPGPCWFCGGTLPDHRAPCPGPALEAEARAIREEEGR